MVGAMLRSVMSRAWSDTFRSLGGWSLVATIVVIPVVGFGLHSATGDIAGMESEAHVWVIYGLAATGCVFSALFLFNLCCAPYRIERDSHAITKESLRALKPNTDYALPRLLARKENFTLEEAACLLAGQVLVYEQDLVGPAAGFFFEIKQRILSGTIDAGGWSDQSVQFQEISHKMSSFGKEDAIFNPKMVGAWIDRATLHSLADEYAVIIPGVTAELHLSQSQKDIGSKTRR